MGMKASQIRKFVNNDEEENRRIRERTAGTWEPVQQMAPPTYDYHTERAAANVAPTSNMDSLLNSMYEDKKKEKRNFLEFKPLTPNGKNALTTREAIQTLDNKIVDKLNDYSAGRFYLDATNSALDAPRNAVNRLHRSVTGQEKLSKEEVALQNDLRRREYLGYDKNKEYGLLDNVSQMTGQVGGQLASMFMGSSALKGATGAIGGIGSKIANNAAVAAGMAGIRSYGEGNDQTQIVKDALRDGAFYAAGTGASEALGGLFNASTKLGQYGVEAAKGLAFDAAGYAATMPSYKMLGDEAPTGKDIAVDMLAGALFDFIPNAIEVANMDLPMLKSWKTQNTGKLPQEANTLIDNRIKELETKITEKLPQTETQTAYETSMPNTNPNLVLDGAKQSYEANTKAQLENMKDTQNISKYEPTNRYGESGNKSYNYFREQTPVHPEIYDTYFDMVYQAGKDGLPKEQLQLGEFEKYIPNHIKEGIYAAGTNDAKLNTESKSENVPRGTIEKIEVPQDQVKATKNYELETKQLLGERQKEVYEYLQSDKDGKKAKEYYLSPELNGVDELKKVLGASQKLIKFTNDKTAPKLDVMKMEMETQFPEVKEMGLEEFGTFLVDTVKKYKGDTKEIAGLKQEIKTLPQASPKNYIAITKDGKTNPITDQNLIAQLNQIDIKDGGTYQVENNGYKWNVSTKILENGDISIHTTGQTIETATPLNYQTISMSGGSSKPVNNKKVLDQLKTMDLEAGKIYSVNTSGNSKTEFYIDSIKDGNVNMRLTSTMSRSKVNEIKKQSASPKKNTKVNDNSEVDGYGYSNLTSTATGPKLGAATGDYAGEAKKASEIFNDFGKKLGMTIKLDKRLKKALGQQNYRTGLTNVKKANDIPVLSHETGHFIDNELKLNTVSDPKINQELMTLGKVTSRDNYSPDKVKREGIAEFTRLFLTDAKAAQKQAPNFYKYFNENVPVKTMKALNELQTDIYNLTNLSPVERLKKTISFRTDYMGMNKVKKDIDKVKSFNVSETARNIYTGLFDKTYPMEWAARMMGGKSEGDFMKHKLGQMRGYAEASTYSLEYAQTDFYGKEIGPSWKEITKPIHANEKLRQDFWTYAAAKRSLDYFERGLEFTDDLEVSKAVIASLETPEFKEIFDKVQKYNENNLNLLVEAGLYSKDQVDAMKEVNPNYIPLNRVQEAFEKAGGKGGSKGVKNLKGGGQDIRDPEENIILNTISYRKMAMEKSLWRDLADLADVATGQGLIMNKASTKSKIVEGPGSAKATAKGKESDLNLNKTDIENIVTKSLKEMGFDPEGIDIDFYTKLFIPDVKAGPNQVVVYREGKAELYDVDKSLYDVVNPMTIDQSHVFMKFVGGLSKVASLSKTGIIFNPRYIAWNLMRDTTQSLINSKGGINPLDIGLGLIEAGRKGDTYKAALRTGGSTGFVNANDRNYAQEQIDQIVKGKKLYQKALNVLKHPLEPIANLTEPGEMAARLPEYKKTIIKEYRSTYKNTGETKEQIFKKVTSNPQEYQRIIAAAAYNMRDLSLDFNRSGSWVTASQLNRTNNFFNSQIQGVGKTLRTYSNPETALKATWKGIATITLPSLALWWYNKDNENYQELPTYKKDFYMNIPVGQDGVYFPIPLPYEQAAMFSALPIRMMEKEVQNNPKAYEGFMETIKETFFGLEFMPTALLPIYENIKNENFAGSPIVSMYEKEGPPELQVNQYTSELAKKISSITREIPIIKDIDMLVSPKQLDHLLKGYTGTLGTMAITGRGVKGVAESFVTDAKRSPQSLSTYYEYKDALNQDRQRVKAGMEVDTYSEEVRIAFNAYDKKVQVLSETINEMRNNKADEKEIRKYTDERLAIMKEANKLYEDFYYNGNFDLSKAPSEVKGKYYQSQLKAAKEAAGNSWNKESLDGLMYTTLNSKFNKISTYEKALENPGPNADTAAIQNMIDQLYKEIETTIKTYESKK